MQWQATQILLEVVQFGLLILLLHVQSLDLRSLVVHSTPLFDKINKLHNEVWRNRSQPSTLNKSRKNHKIKHSMFGGEFSSFYVEKK